MKLKVWVETRKLGSRCETTIPIDDEEIEGMTEDEFEKFLEEKAITWRDKGSFLGLEG